MSFLGVSALHALWDSMHEIAVTLTLLLTGGEAYRPTPRGWVVVPTPEQVRLIVVLDWAGPALVAALGVAWLVALWRTAPRWTGYRVGWRVPMRPRERVPAGA
jgi:hypothetical protein